MNESDQKERGHRLFALAFVAVIVGIIAIGAVPGTAVAEHANTTDDRIQIVDAFNENDVNRFNSDGNVTVAVQATTNESVSDLQFYNNTAGVGPLNFGNGGIVTAEYDDKTTFDSSSSFSRTSGNNGIVFFELNQSWSANQIQINVSAEGKTYDAAATENRSVLTTNSYSISVVNASGNPITAGTPLFVSNSSNTLYDYVFTIGGGDTFHCGGVVSGATCEDPDTDGSAHTYPINRSWDGARPLPADPDVQAFELSTANGSVETDLAPGSNTVKANESAAPVQFLIQNYNGAGITDITEIRVETRTGGTTVQRRITGISPGGPLILSPKTDYDIVIERASGETYRRPMTVPTKGFRNQRIRVSGDLLTDTSEVVGQVLNESGEPVENVTVTAEPTGWGGQPPAYNSTTTDENGLFAMELPETRELTPRQRYQFQLASSQTDNGTLIYFPTRADRQGDGYEVRDSRTILPPLEIERGAEIDINVTNASGGSIGSPQSLTSLSQTTTATGDRTRESVVESIGLFKFPNTGMPGPTETVVRVPSPTTGVQDDVSYNVWGFEQWGAVNESCAQPVDVSQGERTISECRLENGGTLNVTLEQYGSIVQKSNSEPRQVGAGDAYSRNVLIVRNATTGNVTTYLGPSGVQQWFIGNGGDPNTLSLPVPAGNYTVELRPKYQWIDRTSVRNTTNVSVTAGQTSQVALGSGRDFLIEPDPQRTDTTFRRTGNNSIAVRVADPVTVELLNDSEVNVSLRLLYQNGTVASSTVSLEYNSTTQGFENTTYTPDVSAGRYIAQLKATHRSGNSTYNTTIRERLEVSDFATQIQTRRQTVGINEPFQARLRAFNLSADPPSPISASSDNITLTIYDRNGNALGESTSNTGLTDGRGTIELPGVENTGIYRIGVVVEADDGRQGIADTWVRISSYDLSVDANESVYAPGNTVQASVTLTDTAGDPVSDATLETTVRNDNGTVSVTNSTDSNGEADITLDPGALFDGTDTWDRSTFAEVEATIETSSGLDRVRAGTGIRVRSFQADASSAEDQYASGEKPVIDVVVPPGTNIDSINATEINGQEIDSEVSGTKESEGFYRITLDSDLTKYGVQSQGSYRVQVEATNTNGRTVTDRARFTVSDVNVRAEPTARSYSPSENVTVNAEIRYTNGTTVDSGESVSMKLYEEGTDPILADQNTTTTDSDGGTTAELSPDSEGVHIVVVSAGGSERTFPVLVNNITTEFTDGSGTTVESYEFTPGQNDASINISAENSSGGINGEMTVRAIIDGRSIELGTSDITNGEGGVSFSIPESANTGTYPVEVFVLSETGAFDSTTARIELTADATTVALESVEAQEEVYAPGDSARIQAVVTEGGDPVSGKAVDFTLVSEDVERSLDSGTSGADGTVTINQTIPSDLTNGEYGVRARLAESGKTASDGVSLSDVDLSVDTNESAYATGDTVTVNLTATSDGDPVSDAEGGVRIRLADGGTVTETFNGSGEASPYEVDIELPEDDAIIGSRTVEAFVRNGSSVATGSTVVDVFNASEDTSLSVPEAIIANETDFTVTANATVETNATLTVFSPGTGSVAYEEDLSLNETTSLNLSAPGTYVFRLSVPGVGTDTVVRNVDEGPGDPELYVGDSLTTNATEFDTSDDIYIRTDAEDMTARVFSPDDSFTVPLNRNGGEGRYGTLSSADTDSGPYLIRLDGQNATDADSVLIEVSD